MSAPAFTIRTRPTPGAPYTIHSIVLADGSTVHEQLSPYGKGEPEERIRDFLKPTPATATVVKFDRSTGKPRRSSPGRPKRGDAWRNNMHMVGDDPGPEAA